MLRSKLAPISPTRRRSDFADAPDTLDAFDFEGVACEQQGPETFSYGLPIRRSRSDGLFDRQVTSSIFRRGSELSRASSAGICPVGLHQCTSELVQFSCIFLVVWVDLGAM